MAQVVRKAQPDCLRYFLKVLRCPNGNNDESQNNNGREESSSIDNLVEVLIKFGNYSLPDAKDTVANALRDGILMPVSATLSSQRSQRSSIPELKRVRLPTLSEIKLMSTHDRYCYECHLPGMLEECRQCWRSFHRLCYRKNPERPNYAVPSSKIQKNRLPEFSSDTESENDDYGTVRSSTALGYESDLRANSSLMPLDQSSIASGTINSQHNITGDTTNIGSLSPATLLGASNELSNTFFVEGKPLLDDLETKAKVEVVCIGEIRPPDRKRPNTTASSISYKSEISPNEEEENDLELCTGCRLLKRADLRNPANLKADELCHLVRFTFSYNREWLTYDVCTYLESKRMNATEINIVSHMLLHSKLKGLNDISTKLEKNEYEFLMDFMVDLLDIQHSIGVFFGAQSTELESTKWFIRDITHDLSEIRRCPDCFRYSHEKQSSIWFAKPCVQRHELVYAKHSGFPYWPAKVIRVLPNNKFDVRFFGGNHSRALIDVRFIKPIDADTKSLKLGNSPAIKKAMEELRYHQMLSSYPPSAFSFYANPQHTEEIIRTVLASSSLNSCETEGKTSKRKRKKSVTISTAIPDIGNNVSLNLSQEDNSPTITKMALCTQVSVSLKRLKINHLANKSNDNNNNNSQHSKRATRKYNKDLDHDDRIRMLNELDYANKVINEYKQKNEKLEAQKRKLKEAIKKQELERKILKRKQWCYWCLEEAIYLCCFGASYCSDVCQARHWKDGHSKVCKNPSASEEDHNNLF